MGPVVRAERTPMSAAQHPARADGALHAVPCRHPLRCMKTDFQAFKAVCKDTTMTGQAGHLLATGNRIETVLHCFVPRHRKASAAMAGLPGQGLVHKIGLAVNGHKVSIRQQRNG